MGPGSTAPKAPSSPFLATLCAIAVTTAPTSSQGLEAHTHQSKNGKLPYRLFQPSIGKQAKRRFPLVLFLHGAGERGKDNTAQLRHGVRDFVSDKNQTERPCFVIAPQCPRGVWWMDEKVFPLVVELLDQKLKELPIDRDRVYITGLSMGGYGTWHALQHHGDRFAAAIPVCGGGDPAAAGKFAETPIWAFHGDADRAVKVEKSREMIAALKKAGGRPKYTEYPGVGHNSWTRTYRNSAVHEWLFAQVRRTTAALVKPLQDGDRVVFFGDSITWAGARGKGYIRRISTDLQTHRPKLKVELIGAGISGNRVPDLLLRLEKDVLSERPSIVVIYIGINDVWHWENGKGTKPDAFETGLRDLIAKIRRAKARVILCTPSVIGEKTDGTNPYDKMLDEYAGISRKIAKDTGTQLLDLRREFLDHLRAHNGKNADRGILTSDTVHLNPAGNGFVARCMLRALGVTGAARQTPRQPDGRAANPGKKR